jgi:hypothetical protein
VQCAVCSMGRCVKWGSGTVLCSAVQCSAAGCAGETGCSITDNLPTQPRGPTVQCSAVQCSAVQCSVQCSVQCRAGGGRLLLNCWLDFTIGTARWGALHCTALHCTALHCTALHGKGVASSCPHPPILATNLISCSDPRSKLLEVELLACSGLSYYLNFAHLISPLKSCQAIFPKAMLEPTPAAAAAPCRVGGGGGSRRGLRRRLPWTPWRSRA